MLQRKDQQGHEEQRRDQLQDTFAEEVQHGARATPCTAALDVANGARHIVPSPLVGEGGGWPHRQSPCRPPTPTLPHKVGGSRKRHGENFLTSTSIRRRAPIRPASAGSPR